MSASPKYVLPASVRRMFRRFAHGSRTLRRRPCVRPFAPARRGAVVAALTAVVVSACAHQRIVADTPPWAASTQLVLVTTANWNAGQGQLRRYERENGAWRLAATPVEVAVGRAGSAWGLGLHPKMPGPHKREGDGRAPAGVFRIGPAFGYAPHADTALPYQAMTATHYCIDVSGSPLYNRIVDSARVGADAVAGSTEPMRRDLHAEGDPRYRFGFVIDHNPDAQANAGSCIFAHLWKAPGETTAGCTAMNETAMRELLAWLRPERAPVFVLLPQDEYAQRWRAWALPSPDGAH